MKMFFITSGDRFTHLGKGESGLKARHLVMLPGEYSKLTQLSHLSSQNAASDQALHCLLTELSIIFSKIPPSTS